MALSFTQSRGWRWALGAGSALLLAFAVKLALLYGPKAVAWDGRPAPGLFGVHARGILKSELGFPRTLEGFLPVPEKGSSQALQLSGMGFWNGQGWTAHALALGSPESRGLRLPLGRLALEGIGEASPARDYNGPVLCQVDFTVRWDASPEVQDLLQHSALVGLRMPERASLVPGGRESLQATFERQGLGWRLQDADRWRRQLPGRPNRGWAWLAPLL